MEAIEAEIQFWRSRASELEAEVARLMRENTELLKRVTILPAKDYDAFLKALDDPPAPNERLIDLMRKNLREKQAEL